MTNIVTHNTNLPMGSVQAYATSQSEVVLDLNRMFVGRMPDEDNEPAVYRMTPVQALALSRILDAALRDTTTGTYGIPAQGESA